MKFRIYGAIVKMPDGTNYSPYVEKDFETVMDCYKFIVDEEKFIAGAEEGFVVQGYYEVNE